MSLVAVGLGIAGGLLGSGGPSYANGLKRVAGWRKDAIAGDVAAAQSLVKSAGLQGNPGSQYSETRTAARVALADVAIQSQSPDARAVAAAALAGVGVALPSTPNGPQMGTPTLGQPGNLPGPVPVVGTLTSWWPWILGALVLLFLFLRK